MTSVMGFEERLSTVLRGEIPDRVPFIPLLYYYAASFSGVRTSEFLTRMSAYRKAMDACFWEIGPWDAIYTLPFTMDAPRYDVTWGGGIGMKPVFPSGARPPQAGRRSGRLFAQACGKRRVHGAARLRRHGSQALPPPHTPLFE